MKIKTVLLLLALFNGVVIPYTQTETVSQLNNYLTILLESEFEVLSIRVFVVPKIVIELGG